MKAVEKGPSCTQLGPFLLSTKSLSGLNNLRRLTFRAEIMDKPSPR